MEFDHLKSSWKSTGQGKISQAELLMMTRIKNHPHIKRTRIKLLIETILIVVFLAVYYDGFDSATKPLWANFLLIGTTTSYINIPMRQYTDHGPIELSDGRRPRYCQGLEVASNGMLYIVGWVNLTDKTSDKWVEKLAIETADKPAMDIQQSKELQEINLIEIKNPLFI